MNNKYLEKIAALVRSPEMVSSRVLGLVRGVAKRERLSNIGLGSKPDPIKAKDTLHKLRMQSKNTMWDSSTTGV